MSVFLYEKYDTLSHRLKTASFKEQSEFHCFILNKSNAESVTEIH